MLQIAQKLAVRVSPAVACDLRTSVCSVGHNLDSVLLRRRLKSSGYTVGTTLRSTATAVQTSPAEVMPETAVQGLQPQALWDYFYALTQIPRPSKCEDK